ncbi:hypothetical protein AJ79_03182 [Helicocarpus griseus UAMH5409]|uniref:Uncharacterized protein n=1 Tax=Helicocarpus griseus UAMH5409 TaxID=1447875 RepID=A0A2B7XZ64_9EURO|nr:hypothetical protein AJ79_03182 [Helicocarpus griseus UAMH5409]
MAAATGAGSFAPRQVANIKQVHIKMVPSPRTLAESQLILGAMKKFGEVSYFLNLKHIPSSRTKNTGRAALAIFENAQASSAAIQASPLTIPVPSLSTLLPESNPPDGDVGGSNRTKSAVGKLKIKAKTKEARLQKAKEKSKSAEAEASSRESSITCYIEPSYHDHNIAVMQNPYHNAFHLANNSVEIRDILQTAASECSGTFDVRGYDDGSGQIRPPRLSTHADCFPMRKRQFPFRHQLDIIRLAQGLGGDSLMRMYREGRETAEKVKHIREKYVFEKGKKEKQRMENGEENKVETLG